MSCTQRRTSASVAPASIRYAAERRAEGGAFNEPRSVATRLRRPSGHVSDATASTIASPMSSGSGGGGLEIESAPRVDGDAYVARTAWADEGLAEVCRHLLVTADTRLREADHAVGARLGDERGAIEKRFDRSRASAGAAGTSIRISRPSSKLR